MRTLKPERTSHLKYGTTMEDVMEAYLQNQTLTGKVTYIHYASKTLQVILGEGILAVMPWSEATIYKFSYKSEKMPTLPTQISTLLYRKVRVKVKEILEDGTIVVSRKENMLKALEEVKFTWEEETYQAVVTGKYPSGIFMDIGEGLIAFCHVSEISMCRVNVDTWVKKGETYSVKIVDVSDAEDNYRMNCSIRKANNTTIDDFKEGQIVNVRISNPVYNGYTISGYFAELSPNITGIADIRYEEANIREGELVYAIINRIKSNEDGLVRTHLTILGKVNDDHVEND